MEVEEYIEYLRCREELDRTFEKIRVENEEVINRLLYVIRDIIGEIEKKYRQLWYAGPSTIKLTPYLVLEVEITSYNMGVIDYLKEIKTEILNWINREEIKCISMVDVYWMDTLPGRGNLGVRRD